MFLCPVFLYQPYTDNSALSLCSFWLENNLCLSSHTQNKPLIVINSKQVLVYFIDFYKKYIIHSVHI
jgi:hypothetical protein